MGTTNSEKLFPLPDLKEYFLFFLLFTAIFFRHDFKLPEFEIGGETIRESVSQLTATFLSDWHHKLTIISLSWCFLFLVSELRKLYSR
jgi:hypothetical protein